MPENSLSWWELYFLISDGWSPFILTSKSVAHFRAKIDQEKLRGLKEGGQLFYFGARRKGGSHPKAYYMMQHLYENTMRHNRELSFIWQDSGTGDRGFIVYVPRGQSVIVPSILDGGPVHNEQGRMEVEIGNDGRSYHRWFPE